MTNRASHCSQRIVSQILFLRNHLCDIPIVWSDTRLAPLLEGVKYEWYSFPNKLGATSPYRGQPNEELESKWADLAKRTLRPSTNYTMYIHRLLSMIAIIMSFPPDRLPEINKSITHDLKPWMPVRQIASGGKGNGLYAQPEFAHQLHCLVCFRRSDWSYTHADAYQNLVRKYTYREDWDYTHELEWADGPETLRSHVDHCLETLRISLMCTADVTPILITMDPVSPLGGYPDFETIHRCRNIDNLLEWAGSEGLLFNLTNRTIPIESLIQGNSSSGWVW